MRQRTLCETCQSRFFADEDDILQGHVICSHCWPFVSICELCRKPTKSIRMVGNDLGICGDCKKDAFFFPNTWLIRRFMTMRRDNFTCRYCGRSPISDESVTLQIDHVIPRSKGGLDELSNLVTSCAECNSGKTDIMLDECQRKLLRNRRTFGTTIEQNDQVEAGQEIRG